MCFIEQHRLGKIFSRTWKIRTQVSPTDSWLCKHVMNRVREWWNTEPASMISTQRSQIWWLIRVLLQNQRERRTTRNISKCRGTAGGIISFHQDGLHGHVGQIINNKQSRKADPAVEGLWTHTLALKKQLIKSFTQRWTFQQLCN